MFIIKKKMGSFYLALVILYVNGVACKPNNLIKYYEDLINTETKKALNYQPQEDAGKYEANSDVVTDLESYDFIIIGAGSTGSVIANRLSEIDKWKILVLEAGEFSNIVNQIPALYPVGVFSDYNWGYRSIPQKTACLGAVNESCLIPTGRGIGGTTLINGLVYSRGHPTDYNRWAKITGDESWAYKNIVGYFKKSEDFHQTDNEAPIDWGYHGRGGNLNVEHHNPSIALKHIFMEANKELGYNITDYNSPSQLGYSVIQYNTKQGKRHDHGTAFISPILNRINLEVLSQSYVTRIIINNVTKEATGCSFTRNGKTYVATANKEIILSAGAISSPKILMLSGIGPKQHLQDVGIPFIEDLPVGKTLRDHASPFALQFTSNMSKLHQSLDQMVRDYLNGTGALTSNSQSHVIAWYKSTKKNRPDLEIVTDVTEEPSELGKKFSNWKDDIWKDLQGFNTSFRFNLLLLHPRSIGSVKLKSNNTFHYPLIDYNLLSDNYGEDIDTLYKGIQLGMKLIETKAFKEIGAKLGLQPLKACKEFDFRSKDYWYCFIRQTTLAMFHPIGTCPMGVEMGKGAVVDSSLRVFGIGKLRVADASVFPSTLSGHPSAACTMVGEKVSDIIKSEYLHI